MHVCVYKGQYNLPPQGSLWFYGTGCTPLLWGVGWQGCSGPQEQQVSAKNLWDP